MKNAMRTISQVSNPPWLSKEIAPSSPPPKPVKKAPAATVPPAPQKPETQPEMATQPVPDEASQTMPLFHAKGGFESDAQSPSAAQSAPIQSNLQIEQQPAPLLHTPANEVAHLHVNVESTNKPVNINALPLPQENALPLLAAQGAPIDSINVQPAADEPSWRVLSALAAREAAKDSSSNAQKSPESRSSPQPNYHSSRPQAAKPSFGFEANRSWQSGQSGQGGQGGQGARGGYLGKNPRDMRSQPGRSGGFTGFGLSPAGAQFEALFSAKSDVSLPAAPNPRAQPLTAIASALVASGTVVIDPLKAPEVIVKRRRLTLKGMEAKDSSSNSSNPSNSSISGGAADAAPAWQPQPKAEVEEPFHIHPSFARQESAPHRTFLVPAQAESTHSALAAFSAPQAPAPTELFDFDALALTERKDQLPAGVFVIEQEIVDANLLRARLETLAPEQAAAWLLATPERNLRPLSHPMVRLMIQQLIARIDDEALHALHPASHWVSDPFREIAFHSDRQYRRQVKNEAPSTLPGSIGVWLGASKLGSAESGKRSANAQRINAVSLAGIVMASNRIEALEWMLADRLDPLRVAARLGCAQGMESKGHQIGEVSGYALALLAHASQFFSWCTQWESLLRERALGRTHELSRALSLAIKTWTGAHGELAQDCAEMAAVMLQLGATFTEWGLLAFSPLGRREAGPAVAWARFSAQTFGIDHRGSAAHRIIESAKIHGFDLTPVNGDAQPMMPFAQANLQEAVAVFLRAGFDPNLTDALGQTALSRANSVRADRVVRLLITHAQGEPVPDVHAPEMTDLLEAPAALAPPHSQAPLAVQAPSEPWVLFDEPAEVESAVLDQAQTARGSQTPQPLGVQTEIELHAELDADTADADFLAFFAGPPDDQKPAEETGPTLAELLAEQALLENTIVSMESTAHQLQELDRLINPPAHARAQRAEVLRTPLADLLAQKEQLAEQLASMELTAHELQDLDRLIGLSSHGRVQHAEVLRVPLADLLAQREQLAEQLAAMELTAHELQDLDRLIGLAVPGGPANQRGLARPLAQLLDEQSRLEQFIASMEATAQEMRALDPLLLEPNPRDELAQTA